MTFLKYLLVKNIVLALMTLQCFGVKPIAGVLMEMTLYANADYTGQSITLNQTHQDFECVTNVVGAGGGIKSVCYVGAWQTTMRTRPYILYPNVARSCREMPEDYKNVTDVYQVGPPDTSTPAITFFRGRVFKIVDGASEANLAITAGNIVIYHVYTSGGSNWTLYEGNNFEGNSACVISPRELNHFWANEFGLSSIGSVIKGCGHKLLDEATV